MSKESTIHLVYWREYTDSEERYEPDFKIHNTIFRNVPLSQLKRLNSKELKEKVKEKQKEIRLDPKQRKKTTETLN